MTGATPVFDNAGHQIGYHAFLYSPAVGMTDIGTLGGSGSIGYAINSSDQIVGTSFMTGGSGVQHAFLYTPGKARLIDLNTLIAGSPLAPYVTFLESHGINDYSMIVADGLDVRNGQTHAYLLAPISGLLASLKAEVIGVGPEPALWIRLHLLKPIMRSTTSERPVHYSLASIRR
jgi:probable HAF family extracellular repeat protein